MASELFPVLFDGSQYDLHAFLRDHPGGVATLSKYRGKSVAQAMRAFDHSAGAYHMLRDFKVTSDVNLTGEVSVNGRIITQGESDRKEEVAYLEQLEARLDWSKPLLAQLELLGPDYGAWVNSAVHRRVRLFASPALERLTFVPWYIVPLFWVPVILYLMLSQFSTHVMCGDSCMPDSLSTPQYLGHLVAGLGIWSALEYSLHRWVFHLDPGTNLTLMKLHFLIHGLHHKTPFDGLRQVFPPVPAVFLTCIIYIPLSLVLSYSVIKLAGALIGYLTYDMIHYYVHHGSPRDGSYLYDMKRYHSNHHFINHDKGFGISSNVWDYIFGTYARVKKLGFSLQW